MIVFWLSQTSNVTPPIALAAYAGAGIAGASPLGSAVEACKLAAGFFIIPVMMAYSSLLFVEGVTFVAGATAVLSTVALIGCVTAAIEGYAIGRLVFYERLALALAAALIVYPSQATRWTGIALAAGAVALHAGRIRVLPASGLAEAKKEER